ncbi:GntR family transcriptional regulator [Pseudonocardia ailaonensis]|uniref:GntR family transcriptional regulator n=2 Tax=Pseudonocardia ailaonensis TaxID=367279 RepID=A0ABN2NMU3_9PSEU
MVNRELHEYDRGVALRSLTKSEAAYQEIRAQILDGRLAPDAIVDQDELSASLQLSTTPVREALRRLEAEQLVTMEAHRRLRVAPLDPSDVRHLYVVRIELEPLAAELAAEAATSAAIAYAQALVTRDPSESSESFERLGGNPALHRAIYLSCGNPILITVLESLSDRAERYRMLLVDEALEVPTAQEDHRKIVEAFAERDGKRLRGLMREHLIDSLAHFMASPPSVWRK